MRSPVLEDIRVGNVPWPAKGQNRLLLRTLGRRVAAIVLFSGLAFACDEPDTRSDDDAGTLSMVPGDDATDATAGPVGDNMVDMAQPDESATQDARVDDNGGATTVSLDADIDRTDASRAGSDGGEVTELNRDAGDVGITDIDSEFAVGGESGQMLDSTTNDAHQSAPDAAVRSDMMGAPECGMVSRLITTRRLSASRVASSARGARRKRWRVRRHRIGCVRCVRRVIMTMMVMRRQSVSRATTPADRALSKPQRVGRLTIRFAPCIPEEFDHDNDGLTQCIRCDPPCPRGTTETVACKATSNRCTQCVRRSL